MFGNLNFIGEYMIKIFSSRREKLAAEMQSGDLIVVFANETPSMPVPFLQDKNFYYLTGLEIPQAIFLLEKINNKSIAHLFILRGIPEMEVWEGKKMTVEEAKEITGIESVQYLDRFNDFISAKLPTMQRLWVNTKQLQFNDELDKRAKFVQTVRERFIHLTFQPISNLLKNLRMIKDEWEIEQFSKA
jgi:Xaa-Pro aminopeptidase